MPDTELKPGFFVRHYYCDPKKNTTCKKTSCFMNGGPCMLTIHPEYASSLERVKLIGLVDKKDFEDVQPANRAQRRKAGRKKK